MAVIHLYLKKGSSVAAAVNVVKHTFTGHVRTEDRFSRPFADFHAWLAKELESPDVKGVWKCHGCLAKKPDGYKGAWIEVPAGNAVEQI
jgi:hypothetical protein